MQNYPFCSECAADRLEDLIAKLHEERPDRYP